MLFNVKKYEHLKKELQEANLSSEEYEEQIKKILNLIESENENENN